MGGELCINAKLAFASTQENKKKKTTITVPLEYKKQKNIILFKGIGYIINNKQPNKKGLKKLAKKYNLPAFGVINYKKNKIQPYVYVKKVNSFVRETACGSGSIAYSLFSGYKNIIQPTNKIINIRIKKDKILITAEVKECK